MNSNTAKKLTVGAVALCVATVGEAEPKLEPLSDAISDGATVTYPPLRCAGLFASVLSLELPSALSALRPKLKERFFVAHKIAVAQRLKREDYSSVEIAKKSVKRDVFAFAAAYTEVWNTNYVRSGHYLNRLFDRDIETCQTIMPSRS